MREDLEEGQWWDFRGEPYLVLPEWACPASPELTPGQVWVGKGAWMLSGNPRWEHMDPRSAIWTSVEFEEAVPLEDPDGEASRQ